MAFVRSVLFLWWHVAAGAPRHHPVPNRPIRCRAVRSLPRALQAVAQIAAVQAVPRVHHQAHQIAQALNQAAPVLK